MTMRQKLLMWGAIASAALSLVLLARSRMVRALVRFSEEPSEVVVPVAGVEPRACESSFGAPRSEHRTHEGIDIFAKRGTPVVAATDGEVLKVGHDRLGGNVVSVVGEGLKIYYYAHLDQVRPDLKSGQIVRAGEPLGTVGNTGNARTTPSHLHFGVYSATRAFTAVDPAPMLQHNGRTIPYTPPAPPPPAVAPVSSRATHPAAKRRTHETRLK